MLRIVILVVITVIISHCSCTQWHWVVVLVQSYLGSRIEVSIRNFFISALGW